MTPPAPATASSHPTSDSRSAACKLRRSVGAWRASVARTASARARVAYRGAHRAAGGEQLQHDETREVAGAPRDQHRILVSACIHGRRAPRSAMVSFGNQDWTGSARASRRHLDETMRRRAVRRTCRLLVATLARVGDKWSMLIIVSLEDGAVRFNALRRRIGVTQKVLASTLRGLERDGYVTRTTAPTIPPRVDYALTDMGREILVPVRALAGLGLGPYGPHRAGPSRL